jgi:hypothetical protein
MLSVFEYRVQRRTFGSKREEVVGGWRRPKYYLGNNMNEDEMGGACSMHRRVRNAFKIVVRKPERRRHLGRPRYRWANNMRMDLRETG